MSGPLATPGASPFTTPDSDYVNAVLADMRRALPKKINAEHVVGKNNYWDTNLTLVTRHTIKHESGEYHYDEKIRKSTYTTTYDASYLSKMHLKNIDGKDAIVNGEFEFDNGGRSGDALKLFRSKMRITIGDKLVSFYSTQFGTDVTINGRYVPISTVSLKKGELGNFTIPHQVMDLFNDVDSPEMSDRVFHGIAHQEYWDSARHESPVDVQIAEKLPI